MDKRRPQLSADDLARLRGGLGSGLALLAAWSVFFMDIDAWWLLGAVTLASAAAWFRPQWPQALPRWVHRLAFPTLLAFFAFDLYASREPLPALIRLDLLLILYRLVSVRRRREDLQLVVLGLFLIVVGGVLSVSLAFAAQILAFTACALALLFLVHLTEPDASVAPAAPALATGRGGWLDLLRRLRAATDWRLVVLGMGLFAGVVGLSGLLFLAIPRFELSSGLFLDRLINRKTFTGFSDTIEFGEVTDITQDDSIALIVDLDRPEALPRTPYWRMVVLDQYTGRGFTVSPELRTQLARAATRSGDRGTRRPHPQPATWTFYLEPGVSRYLPLLGEYLQLRFQEPQTFAVHGPTGIVALRRDPPKMLPYLVVGMQTGPLPDARLALQRREGGSAGSYLGLPLSEQDRERLDGWVEHFGGPAEGGARSFAARASGWLEQHHTYALQSALPPGAGDPLVRWLSSAAPGHCEYFAGSLVLLARAAGYPARLVTGFKGGSWNPYSGSLSVRNTFAHAWVEIFDDTTGAWIRADPTPGSGATAEDAADALAGGAQTRETDTGWQARLESLRVFWYRRIVKFDQASQLEMATAARDTAKRLSEQLRTWLDHRAESLRDWLTRPWDLRRASQVGAAVILLSLVGWWWSRQGRSAWLRWRSRHARAGNDPIRGEASRWLQRAAAHRRSGYDWPPALIDDLLRLRYGADRTWPDPSRVFQAARRAHRQQRTGAAR